MKDILIYIGLILIAAAIFNAGNGRFIPIGEGSNVAADTRKGTLCYLFDPIGQGSEQIPLCKNVK